LPQSSANRCSRIDVSRCDCRHPNDVRVDFNPPHHSSATPQAIDHKELR